MQIRRAEGRKKLTALTHIHTHTHINLCVLPGLFALASRRTSKPDRDRNVDSLHWSGILLPCPFQPTRGKITQ